MRNVMFFPTKMLFKERVPQIWGFALIASSWEVGPLTSREKRKLPQEEITPQIQMKIYPAVDFLAFLKHLMLITVGGRVLGESDTSLVVFMLLDSSFLDPVGTVLCDISAYSQTRECFDKPNCPGIVTVAVIDYVERFVLRSAVSTGLKKDATFAFKPCLT